MMRTTHRILLLAVFSCIALTSLAQKDRYMRHQVGVLISIPIIYEHMPEGDYQPFLIKGQFSWHLGQTEMIDEKDGHFIFYLEPQINPVWIDNKLKDLEFGCNFGFRYEYELNDANRLYWAIGTGPHFITINTSMQHRGYIFSDNFIMGYQRQIKDSLYANFQYRFRHISNANFMKPNKGLDNHFIGLGLSKLLF